MLTLLCKKSYVDVSNDSVKLKIVLIVSNSSLVFVISHV